MDLFQDEASRIGSDERRHADLGHGPREREADGQRCGEKYAVAVQVGGQQEEPGGEEHADAETADQEDRGLRDHPSDLVEY